MIFALISCRLCTSHVDPDGIISMVFCHLIALNKSPGEAGEVLSKIISRGVLPVVKFDVLEASF